MTDDVSIRLQSEWFRCNNDKLALILERVLLIQSSVKSEKNTFYRLEKVTVFLSIFESKIRHNAFLLYLKKIMKIQKL